MYNNADVTSYGKIKVGVKTLADANIPLVVRFFGVVSNTGLYKQGTFTL